MRIFRVEDYNRIGPFQGGSAHAKFYGRHSHRYNGRPEKYPTPFFDDQLMGVDEDERCGFVSLEALRAWFEPAMKDLRRDGFRVTEYEIPRSYVRFGRHQLVYRADRAKPIATYSWEEVYRRRR